VVYIGINELVLALGLDHVVALLTQSADNAEDGKFAYLSERVLLALIMFMKGQHCLLQVVNGGEGASSTNACAAMK